MHVALRPHLKAGVCLVAAAVVAVAPVEVVGGAPQAPGVHSVRPIALTSLQDTIAGLPVGLAGPFISGYASLSYSLQNVLSAVDAGVLDLTDPLVFLQQALGVGAEGLTAVVNGHYGGGGGLIGTPSKWWMQGANGTIPTLQQLVGDLFGTGEPLPDTGRPVEAAVNSALYPLAAVAIAVADVLTPALAQLPGISGSDATLLAHVFAMGAVGPVIGSLGAAGTAVQDVIDALASGHPGAILNSLIGAPATLIDGLVNGNYGPNLYPAITPTDVAAGDLPTDDVEIRAGGLRGGFFVRAPVGEPAHIILPGLIGVVATGLFLLQQQREVQQQSAVPAETEVEGMAAADIAAVDGFDVVAAEDDTPTAQQRPLPAAASTDDDTGEEIASRAPTVRLNVVKVNPLDPTPASEVDAATTDGIDSAVGQPNTNFSEPQVTAGGETTTDSGASGLDASSDVDPNANDNTSSGDDAD